MNINYLTNAATTVYIPNKFINIKPPIMTELIICECYSAEHQVIFRTLDDTEAVSEHDDVYIHIHLVKRRFWYRLKYGLKYIFGYKCKYGHWDEIITTRLKMAEVLRKLLVNKRL